MKTILLLALALSGCATVQGWERAEETHWCTDDQAERVEREVRFCTRSDPRFAEYCRGASIINNCVPVAMVPRPDSE